MDIYILHFSFCILHLINFKIPNYPFQIILSFSSSTFNSTTTSFFIIFSIKLHDVPLPPQHSTLIESPTTACIQLHELPLHSSIVCNDSLPRERKHKPQYSSLKLVLVPLCLHFYRCHSCTNLVRLGPHVGMLSPFFVKLFVLWTTVLEEK